MLRLLCIAEEHEIKIIILYHPHLEILESGNLYFQTDEHTKAEWKDFCDQQGIIFVDMTDRFREEYYKSYILPYGFSNTPVGEGHSNRYGHRMIAEELAEAIEREEQ